MGRIGSVPLLVLLLLLLACSFPLIVQALPSLQSLPGFLLLQSSLEVFMALLFFQATSVQILRDSILTRVTVRGVHQTGSLKNCASSMYYLIIFSFTSGITNVCMESPSSTLVKLDFVGTKHSLPVTGLPMSNVPLHQWQSKHQNVKHFHRHNLFQVHPLHPVHPLSSNSSTFI